MRIATPVQPCTIEGTLRHQRLLLTISAAVSATLWAYACGDGDGTTEPTDLRQPTTVTVSPATATVVEGDTLRLTATATNAHGQVVTGVEFVWASGNTAVATVDASGLVTGVGAGEVQVTATAAGVTGRAELAVVTPLPTTIAVTPDTVILTAVGQTAQLTAEVRDQAGRVMDRVPVAWLSAETTVAAVDATGLVTAVGNGAVTVTATAGEASGDAHVTVAADLDRAALVALYNATDGPNWVDNANWLTDAPLGEWYGVDTDFSGRVVERLSLNDNALSGEIPPELGGLSEVGFLGLDGNALSGEIPPDLGDLANLKRLYLHGNALSGEIPQSFLQLERIEAFFVGGQDVCVPGVSAFVAWFDGIESRETKAEVFCNRADVAALESLYDLTDGANWKESDGWLGDNPVEDWYGVTADALGHVTELDLEGNGLAGRLSGALGNLPRLTVLRISDNTLEDRLPLSLTALDLDEFHYDGTDLCEPADADFQRWLRGIASRRGTGAQCAPLTERDVLTALYASTGGPGWTKSDGWLSEAPLQRWHGVQVDAQGRVVDLALSGNGLSGPIPPELGNLANLRFLDLNANALLGPIPPELANLSNLERLILNWNELSGEIPPGLGALSNLWSLQLVGNALSGGIPPELGGLSSLARLNLAFNRLSGEIPPELGGLSSLWSLHLFSNTLSGEIPPELGNLANLRFLWLYRNALSGEIPPELGNLANLERMHLAANDLSGPIPPTFGGLASLIELELSHNAGLAGAMPASLRHLALESLVASGTELCVPREPAFEEWIATIPRRRIAVCGEPPAAYLVQAVQSRAHPVPLVAGEDALLRVFVTAAMETTEGIPDVRARFYLNGSERHVVDIAASSTPIPTEINEGRLSKSANAEIPGRILRPGLEMVVEIDPGGVLDPVLGVPGRIPEEGRLAVEVREMPALDLTVIPFLWSSDPDSAIIGLAEGMAADPEGHALLENTHVLLPVGDIDVTAHASVASTSNNTYDLLAQTDAIRVLEGGGGHYVGMMSGNVTGARGLADLGGRSSFSWPSSYVIAHELGHNMGLSHAPCGGAPGTDPSFPYPNGAIGAWGYDFGRARPVPATRKDHMSYCGAAWTSDYHFTNALSHRLRDEGASAGAHAFATVRSLLLWGGVDTTGTPFLNPAFVADAPPTLPDSAGDYTVTGQAASGRELFSLSFTMPVALSEEAEVSSFVFALPVRPGWADALANVALTGPGGTATLDGESDIPMAILRDPRTGQVRGFLRDPPLATEVAADAVGVGAPDLEMLFSRGIPGAAAWSR